MKYLRYCDLCKHLDRGPETLCMGEKIKLRCKKFDQRIIHLGSFRRNILTLSACLGPEVEISIP